MYKPIQLTNIIPSVRNSLRRSPLRRGFLPIALVLACFALLPAAQAVTPAPDGGYPNANTAEGDNALFSLTDGANNTAIGFDALFSNTTGSENTANGSFALSSNTTGFDNTANGFQALLHNTTGVFNTANGNGALLSNTTGAFNVANGTGALSSNTTGNHNTANGDVALAVNTTGSYNTATGESALFGNTSGSFNTANGRGALTSNTTGSNNLANGFAALQLNDTGSNNTAEGVSTLVNNTTGDNNTASGDAALSNNTTGTGNTANGYAALGNNTTGNSNTALGRLAGVNLTTGSNNIEIGNRGVTGEFNTIRVGKVGTHKQTFIAGISAVTVAGGVGVIIDANGQLGTKTSSERFKDEIKPMDKASEAILALQPVTFRYKAELDPAGIAQFGLVAEQVEKINPDLVARDEEGKPYTVRYEAVNAMLLNEFLKEHRKVQDLEGTVAQQQKQIEALTVGLRRVSDQLKVSKAVARLVANN